MPGDDRTIKFAMWPHMITIEGPAEKLAAIVEDLYNDPGLKRELWSLGNTENIGRLAMIARLRSQGKAARRVGLAALTLVVSNAIEKRVSAAGIKCSAMHLQSKEA